MAAMRFIYTFGHLQDYAPTVREVSEALGIVLSHAQTVLRNLEEVGFIVRRHRTARAMHLTTEGLKVIGGTVAIGVCPTCGRTLEVQPDLV